MASSKIDWDRDLAFADGTPAYVSAQVFASGKLAVRTRHGMDERRGESYAELWEQGVRYLVARTPNAGAGAPFNEHGFKLEPWGAEETARVALHTLMPNRVVNTSTIRAQNEAEAKAQAAMEDIPGWGTF